MFDSKKTKLFTAKSVITTSMTSGVNNGFLNAGLKSANETLSGNGAKKYQSSGNEFVDEFGKSASYKKPRSYREVEATMSTLWSKNPYFAVALTFFLRMITRVVSLFDGSKTSAVQRGSGLKHEGNLRMIWLNINHNDVFWKNISLYISVGSWKDIFYMLSYDLQFNGWSGRVLDWDNFGKLILAGLENPNTSELVKKYLPQIKPNSKCNSVEAQADNIIAKWLCSLLFGSKGESQGSTYKLYRKLKTSGTAHEWQKLISQKKHDLIDFNTVHGRALALMVSGKYIENQGLTSKYDAWISSQPIAKYTGYVHELFETLPTKPHQVKTLNAQFKGLVETAKKNANDSTSMIVVRDTSGSMSCTATGTKMSCYNIAKALALFFSEMLPKGAFANSWIEFNSTAKLHQWKGSTPLEKWKNDYSGYYGSTNFQSVIDLFVRIKRQGVAENEFPSGIICISDGEFNPAELGKTNVEAALIKLRQGGFSEEYVSKFKIVLWNLQSGAYGSTTGKKFETYGDVDNVYYFSSYDGSIIAFLTGVEGQTKEPKNAQELFLAAMEQEIMKMIQM